MLRAISVFFVTAGLVACATTADDLIRLVEKRYNAAQTLSVQFVENYSLQGHARPREEGKLTLRKARKMRWDYSRPAGKVFISDGKMVYLYSATENRVEKMPLKNTEDMRAPLAFLLGHLDMKKEFQAFRSWPDEGGTWLAAESKSEKTPYSAVDMLIRPDGSVKELKIEGRDQSLITFSFRDEQMNPVVAENVFHFTVPAGAEVIDSVNWGGQEN